MVEKWKKYFHKEGTWVLLTDLSKAFDCLAHKVLLAKFNANGFDESKAKANNYVIKRK